MLNPSYYSIKVLTLLYNKLLSSKNKLIIFACNAYLSSKFIISAF